jgi:NAD(P)-dependent dehydrogenase (short-subunit alcohol dehydrogenase family)
MLRSFHFLLIETHVMEIKNSVALVTGANRGLVKAFTEALLKAGATRVYAGARHPGLILPDGSARDCEYASEVALH